MTGDSKLDRSDLRATVTRYRPGANRDKLIRFVESRFKTIHSFSQVDKAAGVQRIRLTLTGKDKAGNYSNCENGSSLTTPPSQAWSPVLEAWRTGAPEFIEGCFHSELAGTYPKYKIIFFGKDKKQLL